MHKRTPPIVKDGLDHRLEQLLEQLDQDVYKHTLSLPQSPCPQCKTPAGGFHRHGLVSRQVLVIHSENQVLSFLTSLMRWKCRVCDRTFRHYPPYMLPYSRYLLPQQIDLAGLYLDEAAISYRGVCRKRGLPLSYAGEVAESSSSEAEKEREEPRHLSPMSVHRMVTGLAMMLPLLQQLDAGDLANPINLAFCCLPRHKYRSEERRDILLSVRRVLPRYVAMKFPTILGTAFSFP